MPAPMDDHRTAQARRFRIERPEGLGTKIKVHTRSWKKDPAHAQFGICPPQLFQRRFSIMHRQNADALEARIPPEVSLGERVVRHSPCPPGDRFAGRWWGKEPHTRARSHP